MPRAPPQRVRVCLSSTEIIASPSSHGSVRGLSSLGGISPCALAQTAHLFPTAFTRS